MLRLKRSATHIMDSIIFLLKKPFLVIVVGMGKDSNQVVVKELTMKKFSMKPKSLLIWFCHHCKVWVLMGKAFKILIRDKLFLPPSTNLVNLLLQELSKLGVMMCNITKENM